MRTQIASQAPSPLAGMARSVVAACWLAGAALVSPAASANTIVRFDTSLGSFDVSLDDSATPVTVANFLSYVQAQSYSNTVFHRSIANFVVQGGGYYTDFSPVPAQADIVNESRLPNLRGTIAMARMDSLNSANSQWFINTVDNSKGTRYDLDSRQYAVFGQVLGDGMNVVDAIAALPTYDLSSFAGGVFTDVPLRNVGSSTTFRPEYWVTVSISVVPEPQTVVLMAVGLMATATWARRSGRA